MNVCLRSADSTVDFKALRGKFEEALKHYVASFWSNLGRTNDDS